jgi:DMSO/TMAO reductase YedYZ molybdopterin-dependent catalytic subunit
VADRPLAASPADRRVVVRAEPFNAEAPFVALDAPITLVEDFYVRSNFAVPDQDPDAWTLSVDGSVDRPQVVTLADLVSSPKRTITCTLECAGNNRTRLEPATEGEPWGIGAISTAEFSGVPLAHILDQAGIRSGAVEVRFEGADHGSVRDRPGEIHFERSLPVDVSRGDDVLIAVEMNGSPLTAEHGAPARLLVPGWYGMASVKWLRRIEVLDGPLDAYFQTDRYRYHPGHANGAGPAAPVTTMRVNSMITSHASGAEISAGDHVVAGAAWSGLAPVASVEVSVDGGPWSPAELDDSAGRFAWRRWHHRWAAVAVGGHSLRSRATDTAGNIQPDRSDWNRLGYGNNAIAETDVTVRPRS